MLRLPAGPLAWPIRSFDRFLQVRCGTREVAPEDAPAGEEARAWIGFDICREFVDPKDRDKASICELLDIRPMAEFIDALEGRQKGDVGDPKERHRQEQEPRGPKAIAIDRC